jgi:hypothetical protein
MSNMIKALSEQSISVLDQLRPEPETPDIVEESFDDELADGEQTQDIPEEQPPEPAATPEVTSRPTEDDGAGLKRALHEERQNKKAAQAEAEKSKAEAAKVKELVGRLQRQLEEQLAKANPQPVIDEQVDPIGYTVSKTKQLEEQLQKLSSRLSVEDEQRQKQVEFNNRMEQYKLDAAEYAQIVPDYDDAVNFAEAFMQRDIYATEKAAGRELKPHMVSQLALGRALAMADIAYQQGLSVPEYFYNYAKNLGYEPNSAKPAADKPVEPKVEASRIEKFRKATEIASSLSEGAPSEDIVDRAPLEFSLKGHQLHKDHPMFKDMAALKAQLEG